MEKQEFVHFSYIRRALEELGVVGNMTLKFASDPDAPFGVRLSPRGWRMFRRDEADEYIAKKRAQLGASREAGR